MSEASRADRSRSVLHHVWIILGSALLLALSLLAVTDVGNKLALNRLNDTLAPIADSYVKRLEGLVDLDLPFNQLGTVRGSDSALTSLVDEDEVLYKTDLAGEDKSYTLFVHRPDVTVSSLIGRTNLPYTLIERKIHDSLGEHFSTLSLARTTDDLIDNLANQRVFLVASMAVFSLLAVAALLIWRPSAGYALLVVGYVATGSATLFDTTGEFRALSREAATQSANLFEQDLAKAFRVGLSLDNLVGVDDYITELKTSAPMIGEISLVSEGTPIYSAASHGGILSFLSDRFFKVTQTIAGDVSGSGDIILSVSSRALPTVIDVSLLINLAIILFVLTFSVQRIMSGLKNQPVISLADGGIALSLAFMLLPLIGRVLSEDLSALAGASSTPTVAAGLSIGIVLALGLGFLIRRWVLMALSVLALLCFTYGVIEPHALLSLLSGCFLVGAMFQQTGLRLRPTFILACLAPALFVELAIGLDWPNAVIVANILLLLLATAATLRIVQGVTPSQRAAHDAADQQDALLDEVDALDDRGVLSKNWLWPVMVVMQLSGFFVLAFVAIRSHGSMPVLFDGLVIFLCLLSAFYCGATLARQVPLSAGVKWLLTLVCVLVAFAIISVSNLSDASLAPFALPVSFLMGAARYWLASQPMLVRHQVNWSIFNFYTDLVPLFLSVPMALAASELGINPLFATMIYTACLSPLAFAIIAGNKASARRTLFGDGRTEVSS